MDPISASLYTSENAGKAPSGCSTDMRSANPFGDPTTASVLLAPVGRKMGEVGMISPAFVLICSSPTSVF